MGAFSCSNGLLGRTGTSPAPRVVRRGSTRAARALSSRHRSPGVLTRAHVAVPAPSLPRLHRAPQLLLQSVPQLVLTAVALSAGPGGALTGPAHGPALATRGPSALRAAVGASLAVAAINTLDKGWLLATQVRPWPSSRDQASAGRLTSPVVGQCHRRGQTLHAGGLAVCVCLCAAEAGRGAWHGLRGGAAQQAGAGGGVGARGAGRRGGPRDHGRARRRRCAAAAAAPLAVPVLLPRVAGRSAPRRKFAIASCCACCGLVGMAAMQTGRTRRRAAWASGCWAASRRARRASGTSPTCWRSRARTSALRLVPSARQRLRATIARQGNKRAVLTQYYSTIADALFCARRPSQSADERD